jgi:hypothetical protein
MVADSDRAAFTREPRARVLCKIGYRLCVLWCNEQLPALKSHRNTLTGSFPFTAEFYLKNRAAGVGESSPQFYEDERAREEP